MQIVNKTLSMSAGAKFKLRLRPPGANSDNGNVGYCGHVVLTAKADCYVQLAAWDGTGTEPDGPSASPAPAGGAEADYIHMLAGETLDVGIPGQTQLKYTHVVGWAIAAGDLVVFGE